MNKRDHSFDGTKGLMKIKAVKVGCIPAKTYLYVLIRYMIRYEKDEFTTHARCYYIDGFHEQFNICLN